MATYAESGVNIDKGDLSSEIAYENAKKTFPSRAGMIGEPVKDEGGFTGAMDMGDFYLVQNDDGIGTKMEVAERMQKFDTIGYDLVAMVADDAACAGAECISISNTIDADEVKPEQIKEMMEGLGRACAEHKIVIPGGEIAELGKALNGYVWNATAVGVMEKTKRITGEKIASGDVLIGLMSPGFRSNGLSLVRHVMKAKFGEDWVLAPYEGKKYAGKTWGEVVLIPSVIYHSLIMELHGRYGQPSKVNLKGVAHITGGGIYENFARVTKKTGAKVNWNLPAPSEEMALMMQLGEVPHDDAYRTWNMGIGMILVVSKDEQEKTMEIIKANGFEAQVVGEIA